MASGTARISAETEFASPAAVAALRAQPGFAEAMRASANGLVAMYQGGHLLNWLMDDRGRLLFGYIALYLHGTRDPADPASGLTPTRMKAICAEQGVCSPGRAGAMLSLMRFAGYLAPDIQVVDRRQRRLVATDKLYALLRERWRLHFTAMAPLMADGAAMLNALDDSVFDSGLVAAMVARFRAGYRPLHSAPGLGLFGDRNGGILILASLLTAGGRNDAMPPREAVPISIAALARRFSVSRPHVLKLIRDAGEQDFLARVGPDNKCVVIRPRLAEAAQNFYAAMFLFFADCAREAMRAGGQQRKLGGRVARGPGVALK